MVTTNDIGGPTGWRKAILGMGVGQGKVDTYMPSFAHVALVELLRKGLLKFIVTSNHDNFHIQAGNSMAHSRTHTLARTRNALS